MALSLFVVNFPLSVGSTNPVVFLKDAVSGNLYEPGVLYDPTSGLSASIGASGLKVDTGGSIQPVQAAGVTGSLQASSAQSISANGASNLGTLVYRDVMLFLNISAVSVAGGTIQVYIQSQDPVSANWADVGDFGQIGYDGSALTINQKVVPLGTPQVLSLGSASPAPSLIGASIRARWEVVGASFTFSVGYVAK